MKHRMPLPSIKTILVITVLVVETTILILLILSVIDGESNLRLPTIGRIITLGYEAHGGDILAQAENKTVDWGIVYVGASINRSFILKSKSTTNTIPQLSTTNWTFENQQGQPVAPPTISDIAVSSTLNNTLLAPNEEVNVTITLTVKYDATFVDYLINNEVRTFSFDIIIQPSPV